MPILSFLLLIIDCTTVLISVQKKLLSTSLPKESYAQLIQFVIKTSEIKKEKVKEDKKTKEEQTFFQKFISLFTDLFN